MTQLKNPNFKNSALYSRSKKLMCGGTEEQVEQWWRTPLPYFPFNLRSPQDLLTPEDYPKLERWFVETVAGGMENDVNYFNESANLNNNRNEITNQLRDSQVIAEGGSISYYQKQFGSPVNYKIHTFTSSTTLYMSMGGLVEYLIVGGGGGGGGGYNGSFPVKDSTRTDLSGGGGGGGGVVYGSIFIPSGTWEVTVGGGGGSGYDNQVAVPYRQSSNGGNSSIFGKVALGGGAGSSGVISNQNFGGAGNPAAALIGSSGGGGGYGHSVGALGTNGQGFAGGNYSGIGLAGGGGGAGAAGKDGGSVAVERAGDGGIGFLSNITGSDVYYGGGGGGGCVNSFGIFGTTALTGGTFGGLGGLGGGGSASNLRPGGNSGAGSSNTGGGGAGSSAGNAGGAGGSGIIIIRYEQYKNDRNREYWHYPYSVAP
jgi:hypothetical protein